VALTMAGAAVDAWVEVAQNTIREGTEVDLSGSFQSFLHIDAALSSTTAHTGTRIIIETASSAADLEFWTPVQDFITCVGTANTEVFTATEPAGETVIAAASTTGYTAGLWAAVIDDTKANSEVVRVTSIVTDTSVTLQDPLKRQHTVDPVSALTNIAASYSIELPLGTLRARVLYVNTYDVDGSSIITRARAVTVTALS